MNYVIMGGNYTSPLLHGLEGHFGIQLLSERELRESDLFFDKDNKLYVPSQSSLELVMERMARWPERLHVIEQLMDKYQCRIMMRTLFPNFEFSASKLSIMQEEMFSPGRKYVIKSTKGFLAIGVRALEEPGAIHRTGDEIDWELAYNRQFFSERTLSGENMIIE